jgi:pilus assembly protein CpaE
MSPDEVIRVLIVDDITETRENLKKLLYFETDIEVVGTAINGQEAIELSKQYQPHIVLMDINMPELDGIAASGAIRREVPFVQIIMMSVQSEADYLRRSMMAGASDFLTKPFGSDELVASIRRVYDMSAHLRAIPATQMAKLEAAAAEPKDLGQLVAVYSPKGGVGCTTVAINLAVGIQMIEPDSKVALVDCNLQFGDVGVSLNLRANRTITDLVDHIGELDLDLVESVMTKHDASGVQVLLSPAKPEDADLVSADHVRRVLESMKQLYDYIIVDLGSRLQDLELSVFDLANRIILVTAPDVPSVKDVRYFFELVEALEYPHEKLLLVLNKSDTRTGVTSRLIEGNVKHKIFAEIPYERRSVVQSINQGVPYMIMPNVDKRTPLFQNTIVFAQLVLQEFAEKVEEEREPRERPLGRLLG